MGRHITKDECDLILQGAVVLAGGGGGPLHFARYILDELEDDDIAVVTTADHVKDNDWMTMIALVGTPSKVHHLHQRLSSTGSSPGTSPQVGRRPNRLSWSSPNSSPLFGRASNNNRPRASLYEAFRRITRVKFQSSEFPKFLPKDSEEDGVHTPHNAARNTFLYLQWQCQQRANDNNHFTNRFKKFNRFSYILTGELGAVNMATALYLSAVHGVAVVDCDGAGRSVPQVNQITYADKFHVSPTAIMSPQPGSNFENIASTILDFPHGSEKMVEEVAAALISDENGPFNPYIGYGTYVIKGEQMGDVPVFGSYSMASDVGKAITSFTGKERASAVSRVLTAHGRPNSVVFHGLVTEKVLLNDKVKDNGHLVVEDLDNSDLIKLWYRNEIILAGRPGAIPSYMAPDSICILPAYDLPLDISSIQTPATDDKPLEVFILVIQANEKIKNPKVVKSFESIYQTFTTSDDRVYYSGKFVPWLYENTTGMTGNIGQDPSMRR